MEVYFFHLMPYQDLPSDFSTRYDSAWVTVPNSLYDAQKERSFYLNYLDQLAYADRLGFDGVCCNEHHQTAYGQMPSPNIIAAMLTQRTQNCRIAILGNALSLRAHPVRVAEEVAMIDVISGGRVISGFVRGIGSEAYSFNLNPNESRERFLEAHDLIIRAWTEDGPFPFAGKYYRYRYVNPWPRPLQHPHPPIWIPSQGSSETISWVAAKRYVYLQTYSSISSVQRVFDDFRAATEACGYKAEPRQIGWALPVYVAETDAKAREEAYPHLDVLFNQLLRMPQELFFPPGYLSIQSMEKILQVKKGVGSGQQDVAELEAKGYFILGSPETVVDKLTEYQKTLGFGRLVGMFHFGTLPHYLTMKNLELFAREVLPKVRSGTPKPQPAAVSR